MAPTTRPSLRASNVRWRRSITSRTMYSRGICDAPGQRQQNHCTFCLMRQYAATTANGSSCSSSGISRTFGSCCEKMHLAPTSQMLCCGWPSFATTQNVKNPFGCSPRAFSSRVGGSGVVFAYIPVGGTNAGTSRGDCFGSAMRPDEDSEPSTPTESSRATEQLEELELELELDEAGAAASKPTSAAVGADIPEPSPDSRIDESIAA